MKSSLLKLLLFKPKKNRGFLLPVVMGIGLIMTLLASVNIVRSSQEGSLAVSKKQSSDALAMAEIGVTRYREFLNRNRILALHNDTQWGSIAAVCDSNVSVMSNTSTWQNIDIDHDKDPDTAKINITDGQYQLVSYQAFYDVNNNGTLDSGETEIDANTNNVIDSDEFDRTDDNNNNNPIGVLTVKGRSENSDDNVSEAQVQVTIPLGINTSDFTNLAPALWIQDKDGITNTGTLTINPGGNIIITNPYISGTTAGCNNNITSNINNEIADPRTPPPLIKLPTGIDSSDLRQLSDSDLTGGELILGRPSENSLKEVAESKSVSTETGWDNLYYYWVNGNLNINDGDKIVTDGTAKVVIYIDGDLNIDGNVDITNSSNSATSRYLELHVTGNVNITGSGNVTIKGLIKNNGTFSVNSTLILTGSIWTNGWDNSGSVTITPDDYKFYSVTPERTPQPITYRPTGWETQEVN